MRRRVTGVTLLALFVWLSGCASTYGHRDTGPLPQWPSAPQAARISYLYSITTPEDANLQRSFFSKTWRFIKGAKPEQISKPQSVHVDSSDRMYVVDALQRRVHVFDSQDSRYSWFPEKPIDGFDYPVDVATDGNGRVYVSDSSTNLIHVFDSFGKTYLTAIGKGQLLRPTGLAVRPESAELIVVDTLASAILIFDTRDFSLKSQVGRDGQEDDALHYPTNIALAPDGEVFVTDALNFRIQILSADLHFRDYFGDAGDSPGYFSRPKGVAVDSDGNIYVVDALFDNIQVFNRNGELLLAFGTSGHAAGEFWLPSDIFIDDNDRIYVADSYNARVQVYQYHSQATQ